MSASRSRRQRALVWLPLVLIAAVAAAVAYVEFSPSEQRAIARHNHDPSLLTLGSDPHLGVALPNPKIFAAWESSTHTKADMAEIYRPLAKPLPVWFIRKMAAQGVVTVVQFNLRHLPMQAVANGHYDRVIRADAQAIAALDVPVVFSLGHEMNGDWYSWGCRTPASVFVAAWRRWVNLSRQEGADKIIWMWTPNIIHVGKRPCSFTARWPGRAYVTWVGIDGYLRQTHATFSARFLPTIALIHRLAPRIPLLVAETGATAGPRQVQRILDIYSWARRTKMIGVIYFDGSTRLGDYRPQDNPAALAAFQEAVRIYQGGK